MNESEDIVDARGLACPHPVLRARARLRELPAHARIVLLATDPLASVDVHVFCLRAGHSLISEERVQDHVRFTIERVA
jgi:tRNA 2-thiouridine synthesizing protein A